MSHPHSYPWHDGHTGFHAGLTKAAAEHPHMDGPPVAPGNDQAAGKGVATYAQFAQHFGTIAPGTKTNLFHYDMTGKLPAVRDLVAKHGFQVYYAGGQHGKPDLANKNYNTKHLMVYDPTPSSGGDFGDKDYTDAWRQVHELAHGLTYPDLNKVYGEGRRIGKLGTHRTLNEAKRAVHWEWLAAHKQRELNAGLGIHVPDEVFHKELNTVMHDAVHRAVTGKFTEPSDEGFTPHAHKVPLETSLGLVDQAARNLGLQHSHALLARKHEVDMAATPIDTLRQGLLTRLKKAQTDLESHYVALREREQLAKSEPTKKMCKACGQVAHSPLKKCGEMAQVKKDEESMKPLRQRETVPTNRALPDEPGKDAVLPTDKKSKDQTPAKDGSGGDSKKGEKVAKGDVPMAKPPGGASTPAAPKMSKPTAGGAPKSPAAGLAKVGPRLGGRDPMSQSMTQGAFAAKPMVSVGLGAKGPKLSGEDQARRAAELSAFTPVAHVGESSNQGAAGGASKPPDLGQPSGLELARTPRSRSPILGRK